MTNFTTEAGPYVLTIGPPAIVLVINPYMFYFALMVMLATCLLICVHIINNCAKRDQRIDALVTRRIRRAHNANTANS